MSIFVTIDNSELFLIVGGEVMPGSYVSVEAVLFGDESRICNTSGVNYPQKISSASAAVWVHPKTNKTVPIICGGNDPRHTLTKWNTCHFLSFQNGTDQWNWTQVDPVLTQARDQAASIVIDNGKTLWITGGTKAYYQGLRSTELISILDQDDESESSFAIQAGPDLPLDIYGHCLVKLNSSTAMLIGGQWAARRFKKSTYLLSIPQSGSNKESARPIKGPWLNVARSEHTCGVLRDHLDRQVVIAGGRGSTEMLVVGSGQDWTPGPPCPTETASSTTTTVDGKKLLVFGGWSLEGKLIHQFHFDQEREAWTWTRLDQRLEMSRTKSMVLRVDNADMIDSICPMPVYDYEIDNDIEPSAPGIYLDILTVSFEAYHYQPVQMSLLLPLGRRETELDA